MIDVIRTSDERVVPPYRITFTGVDSHCHVEDLLKLLNADPRVELAILFSASRAGKQNRYPDPAWISDATSHVSLTYTNRLALHLCGSEARNAFLRGGFGDFGLGSLWRYGRIQINGALSFEDGGRLRQLLGEYSGWKVITQYDSNPSLHDTIRRPGHQVLFDASGGRGRRRESWPQHLGHWTCGYAGGLGPDNLHAELPRIAAAAAGAIDGYWIDMESSLRDDWDRFSFERARQALAAVRLVEHS
jgi:hypothetical protein